MIGQLLNNEAHIAVGDFAMTLIRTTVVDFITPFTNSKQALYIRRPAASDVTWNGFLEPFNNTVWFTIFLSIIIIPVIIILFNYHRGMNYSDYFIAVFQIYCQQGIIKSGVVYWGVLI